MFKRVQRILHCMVDNVLHLKGNIQVLNFLLLPKAADVCPDNPNEGKMVKAIELGQDPPFHKRLVVS